MNPPPPARPDAVYGPPSACPVEGETTPTVSAWARVGNQPSFGGRVGPTRAPRGTHPGVLLPKFGTGPGPAPQAVHGRGRLVGSKSEQTVKDLLITNCKACPET